MYQEMLLTFSGIEGKELVSGTEKANVCKTVKFRHTLLVYSRVSVHFVSQNTTFQINFYLKEIDKTYLELYQTIEQNIGQLS